MGLESATTIAGLNPLWPLGTDPKAQGDDHIRMIKAALQANPGGALTQIKRTVRLSSGAFTFQATTKFALVEVYGGGGGGGSSGSSAVNTGAAGGGGGAGGYVSKMISVSAGMTGTLTIGAAGGSTVAGGNTSYSDGTNAMTANGGAAGPTGVSTGNSTLNGGIGGGASGGDINVFGENGLHSSVVVLGAGFNAAARGGQGGDSRLGSGGMGGATNTNAAANAAGSGATGIAAGGGGAATCYAGGVPGGGTGGGGAVVITEFY